MKRAGRPLHFLGGVLGCWVTARAAMLVLPLTEADAPLRDAPDPAPVEIDRIAEHHRSGEQSLPSRAAPGRRLARRAVRQTAGTPTPAMQPLVEPRPSSGAATMAMASGAISAVPEPAPSPSVSTARPPSRWSGTAWLLWRPEGVGGLAAGPLLGGSQMGARIDYRLLGTPDRGLSLYGRASRALARPFAEEAAMGLALRPVRGVPLSLLVERRIALGRGGRNGFALLAAGGIGPKALAPGLEVEGYAQAGIVGLPGADGFADGRFSIDHRLSRATAGPDLALGLNLSGSVQPGAARLDLGPQLRLRLPVEGVHLRLAAEWRERVAGDARPARGPVLTLVADF